MSEAGIADAEAARALEALNTGDAKEARAHAEIALLADPRHVGALRLKARLAFDDGDLICACSAADALVALAPLDPDGLAVKARALARLGRPGAMGALAALEARARVDAASALGRALLSLDRGDGDGALAWLNRAIALNPEYATARALRASCLARVGRLREAEADYDAALVKEPNLVRALTGRARLRSASGAFKAAERDLRAALAAAPGHASALASLLGLRPDDEARLLSDALDRLLSDQLKHHQRIELGYAAAKSLARAGCTKQAFDVAATANALQAASSPYDARAAEADLMNDLGRRPSTEYMGAAAPQPIFVCGLPRTGTTLLEQILARHPDIAAGGELPFFRKANGWLRSQADPEAALTRHKGEFARAYCEGLAARADGCAFIVDKMPENWRYLGLIQHVLGPVRIVRLRRDPRDTALSIFLEHFAVSESFAHDINGIADAIRLERRAFAHWTQASPRAPVIIDYEALTADPAVHVRNLLDALGLAFHADCLAPEEGAAPAATPSRWQVRQSINTSAVGRWRSFAPHAPDFFAAIERAAPNGPEANS